jgi:hypothetical protein
MLALLVVNPHATSTTAAGRDVLAHALASDVKLEILETTYRGHAADAAAQAAADGFDLVVAHGGDGTVNEVVNGLMRGQTGADGTLTRGDGGGGPSGGSGEGGGGSGPAPIGPAPVMPAMARRRSPLSRRARRSKNSSAVAKLE